MTFSSKLMIGALALNIIILVPVVMGMLSGWPFQPEALGPRTAGLMILTSIYASIAVVSVLLIFLHLRGLAWAVPMTVAMFAVQIAYKLVSVPLVGIENPVVVANVIVVAVQTVVLGFLVSESRQATSKTKFV